jgi:DNA-binding NtrC family response regulator
VGRVLYLDDDESLANLLGDRLRRLGHSMTAYSKATPALQAFNRDPDGFDLVLTDMSMPGASGLEFAREILRVRPGAAVIIATGCEDPNWAEFARSAGVREVLLKPLQVETFAETISRLLTP